MSEEKKTETTTGVTRRSMLKTTTGLVVAGAIGVGLGYGASELLRPTAPPGGVVTETVTASQTAATTVTGVPPVEEEKRFSQVIGDVMGGAPAWIYTRAGRIIRVTPMTYSEEEASPWSIQVGDRTFTPRKRSNLATYDQGYRRMVYSPTRIRYPMKRVGFAPGGNSSVENRGKGEFVRISWDEAFDIVSSELKRIKEKYGNAAIVAHSTSHIQKSYVHGHAGKITRFLAMFGGYTSMIRDPDSNEGWFWGGYNVSGQMWPPGGFFSRTDMLEDTMQNCKLLLHWGADDLTSYEGTGTDHAEWVHWIKELGIKRICINSDNNELTAKYADKWIPILPGTDAALEAAIANVWISEGTYEKDFVQTHGYGFDKWKDYVMGNEDGVAKTPEWAEKITGVKARVIRALAREWASKPTSISTAMTACRGPYSSEFTRMLILLLTMQGLGKPGVGFTTPTSAPSPMDHNYNSFWSTNIFATYPDDPLMQSIYYTVFPDAILNPPVGWYGGFSGETVEVGKQSTAPPVEMALGAWGFFTNPTQMFSKTTYPLEGHPLVKMYWTAPVSYITNWNNGYKWMDAFRSPKLEFLVAQAPWFENDAYFMDLLLPVTTPLEVDDIYLCSGPSYGNDVVVRMQKCIEPIGESKSDIEILSEIGKRLGIDYTGGRTVKDMIKVAFEKDFPSGLSKAISLDELEKKGYYVWKFPDMSTYKRDPAMRSYHDMPEGSGLSTPSGKIEFESQNLKKIFPNDKERPPVPHYVAEGPTHQESLTSARAKQYPLIMATSHSRFKWHSRYTSISWLWEATPRYRVQAKNGVWYWSIWINPIDANARGITEGDVLKIFNDRGEILSAAHVTERAMPGMVRCTFGAPYRPSAAPGKPFTDTMGVASLIAPYKPTSANAFGIANGWFLVQVEKWVG